MSKWKIIDYSGRGLGNQGGPLHRCNKCERHLPRGEFGCEPRAPTGLKRECYDCRVIRYPRRRAIILAEYAIFELQNGQGTIVDLDIADAILRLGVRMSVNSKGYALFRSRNKNILLHHFVLGRPSSGMVTDHINIDKLDNRRDNLRFATRRENCLNQLNRYQDGKLYIVKVRDRYKAYTYYNRVQRHLVYSYDINDAKYQGKLKLMEMLDNE